MADHLWGPHALPIEDRLPPAAWLDFCNEITRLFHLIKPHPTFSAAIRMTNRSVRKMATVARMPTEQWADGPDVPDDLKVPVRCGPYIQTGLVQRGLGFGWRLNDMGKDINEIRHYFELMPVSIGVAVTRCPQEIVVQRNRDREKVAATAFENRQHMVPLMQPAIEIAIDVLRNRGVPVVEIDTTQPVEAARAQLIGFSGRQPCAAAQATVDYSIQMLSPPPWWQ